jgi:hypothetical protein
MIIIPIFSTLVTFVFAASVLNRYRHKRGTYLLLWGIGLILYGLGTFSEVFLSLTYSEFVLKLWYLSGAMLTAAWLGQGTIHLLVRKRGVASLLTGVLTGVSLLAFTLIAMAPTTGLEAAFNPAVPVSAQYKDILIRSGLITALTIFLNLYGTIGLVGGAIYSAYLFWRKQVLLDRMVGNLLIAAGALMPAMAGSFVKAGLVDWLYLSELLGAVLMYLGFLRATAGKPMPETRANAAPAAGD